MLTALLLDLRIGIALGVGHLLNHIDDLANYFCLLSLSKLNGDVWYASGDSNLWLLGLARHGIICVLLVNVGNHLDVETVARRGCRRCRWKGISGQGSSGRLWHLRLSEFVLFCRVVVAFHVAIRFFIVTRQHFWGAFGLVPPQGIRVAVLKHFVHVTVVFSANMLVGSCPWMSSETLNLIIG